MQNSTLITCGFEMWEKVAEHIDQQTGGHDPGHALAKVIWTAIAAKESWQNASIEFSGEDYQTVAAAIEAIDADPNQYGPVTVAQTPEERWNQKRDLIWNSSLRELEEIVSRFTKSELMELASSMDGRLEHLLRIRNYVDARVGGCGSDPGHAKAVKAQNTKTRKMRAIMGYPVTSDLNF